MPRRTKRKGRKYLGNRTHGGGNAKNRRGKGSRGGVGRAGYHKHKWLKTIKAGENISRRKGFVNPNASKSESITLGRLEQLALSGKFTKNAEGYFEVALSDRVKVLSQGTLTAKLSVKAGGFSAKAKEKLAAAGGKIAE